jgi:hypothetical protein
MKAGIFPFLNPCPHCTRHQLKRLMTGKCEYSPRSVEGWLEGNKNEMCLNVWCICENKKDIHHIVNIKYKEK